ncbi:MAG: hypothetical protein HYR88_18830 [Verrucomicrobia bacterium]|nr:hypothetical protein [Verrucomicrobiota bacterium]MBI3867907.1 hypothetical protein [Verrucomicrobiota bacterium]
MNSNVALPRNVIIYGLCIPLAMLMGYLLTTPLDFVSMIGLASVLGLLLVPVLLKWHHALLIVSWNAVMVVFFLPGRPQFWMALTATSIVFSILDRIMNKQKRLQTVPWLTAPVVALILVILVTAKLRGGIGLSSIGSGTFGGKKYMEALLALGGYFALSWQKVPPHRAVLYVCLFFLSGLTNAVSNLAYSLQWYWLFWLFPVDAAVLQIQADYNVTDRAFSRLSGVAFACMAPFCFLVVRHGIKGLFDFSEGLHLFPFRRGSTFHVTQPFRLIFFVGAIVLSMFGGFRSMPIIFGLMFVLQFFIERLHKTRLALILVMFGVLLITMAAPFTDRLPLVVQRAVAYLPVKLNPSVRYDAWASTDWRLRMWQVVYDELPKYLWLGKGYGGNATDLYLVRESKRRGFISDFEGSYIAGDYHSGPLSVLVPLGVGGALAFLWFLCAGAYALYRNFRHGSPDLRRINTFLLTYFLAQTLFYLLIYGAFTNGLVIFTGILGLSVSLNGGVARAPRPEPLTEPAPQRPRLSDSPALASPVG